MRELPSKFLSAESRNGSTTAEKIVESFFSVHRSLTVRSSNFPLLLVHTFIFFKNDVLINIGRKR
jgi:hypothetical protein